MQGPTVDHWFSQCKTQRQLPPFVWQSSRKAAVVITMFYCRRLEQQLEALKPLDGQEPSRGSDLSSKVQRKTAVLTTIFYCHRLEQQLAASKRLDEQESSRASQAQHALVPRAHDQSQQVCSLELLGQRVATPECHAMNTEKHFQQSGPLHMNDLRL